MFKTNKFLIYLFIFLIILSGCTSFNISSKWKNNEIKIDGNDSEWKGAMQNQGKFMLGCLNDDKYLYLCISFNEKNSSAELIKLLEQNFSVSFYPLEKNPVIYTLKFTNLRNEIPDFSGTSNSSPDLTSDSNPGSLNNKSRKFNVEVFVGNKSIGLVSDVKGADAAYNEQLGEFNKIVYEFGIPITISDQAQFAVNIFPAKEINEIGITLESSDEFKIDKHDVIPNKTESNQQLNGDIGKSRGNKGHHSSGEGTFTGRISGSNEKKRSSGESLNDYLFRKFLSLKINGLIKLANEKK
jgi:hypothetical protein